MTEKKLIEKYNKYHFIGIGGIGMSGIANVLNKIGKIVSGSDIKSSDITEMLKSKGISINFQHNKENIINSEVIVYSHAIDKNNPELIEAKKNGYILIPREEILNEIIQHKRSIGVTGTHGKTTSSSMLVQILENTEKDPSYIIGGVINSTNSNANWTESDILIVEACEAFAAVSKIHPKYYIVTNIDDDHMEFYKDISNIRKTITDTLNKLPDDGFALLNGDDKETKKIIPNLYCNYYTFGFNIGNHYIISNVNYFEKGTYFTLSGPHGFEHIVSLPLFGKHNIYNAASAIIGANIFGVNYEEAARAINNFINSKRRWELIGIKNEIHFFDDYAHHPTELKAVLDQAELYKQKNSKLKRVVAVFQPHLYTRTQKNYKRFAEILKNTDRIVLLPIFPSREKPIEGVSSELIYNCFNDEEKKKTNLLKINDKIKTIKSIIKEGDIVISIGAGDITDIARQLYKEI